jgi:hypothetical protein
MQNLVNASGRQYAIRPFQQRLNIRRLGLTLPVIRQLIEFTGIGQLSGGSGPLQVAVWLITGIK